MPSSHTSLVDTSVCCAHRYFFDVAALNASAAQAWIDNAFYAQTTQVAGYIANGGLPLVVSEWTLAGARARRA